MLRAWTSALLLSFILQSAVHAQEAASQFPAKPEKLELNQGDSIVFLGDSITHQRLYTQYVEDYLYTRFPHLRLTIHNAGVGGAKAWDALQRFDQDVAAYHPKYVTILLGMNDGTYRPYDEQTFQTYRKDMTELLDKLAGIGATAIPMTPTMFDSRARRIATSKPGKVDDNILLYNSVLAYYGTWLREMATDRGLNFVDMWGPLNNITMEGRETNPRFTLIRDAVHPEAAGQVVMATAIIHDLEFPTLVSKIQVRIPTGGKVVEKAVKGKIQDLAVQNGGITFEFTAQSLPWVLPAEAQEGVKLTHLAHRFSREVVQVNGLASGKYTLKIDDIDVGTYDADQLAAGIELGDNSKTPQYQQSLKVAELNKTRNEGPIRKLRDEWLRFQNYARVKRDHEAKPDQADLAKKFADAEKSIEGLADRVTADNAEAKAIEDEIFKINQPAAHRYSIQPAQ